MTENACRVLYIDLDGTIRHGFDELGRFVNSAADVKVFPEVPAILKRYREAGWKIVGVSNQGGIALGIVSLEAVREAVVETILQCDDALDLVSICQHHPDAKDPEFAICWCRKPKYGNVIESAHTLKKRFHDKFFPPHLALFVGDRPEDQQCAAGIGIQFQWARDWRAYPMGLGDDSLPCVQPMGLTTCGCDAAHHTRYDGKPMDHIYKPQ